MRTILRAYPKRLLQIWALAALVWLASVGTIAWLRIDEQVAAEDSVAQDLARLDCPRGPELAACLAAADEATGASWRDIAGVAWQFEAPTLVGWFALPPIVALLGLVVLMRSAIWRLGRPGPVARWRASVAFARGSVGHGSTFSPL